LRAIADLDDVDRSVSAVPRGPRRTLRSPKSPRARGRAVIRVASSVCASTRRRCPVCPSSRPSGAIDDRRQRPYLVVWGNGAYALKMVVSEGGNAVVVTLTSGETYRIPILRRAVPRGSGTTLFYLCPWRRKPCRFLYLKTLSGNGLVDYLGPRCLRCAGLRFASQGRYRTKLNREFAPILGPRPRRPWDPWAVSDPRIAEKATDSQPPSGARQQAEDDLDDVDDEEAETRPYPGRPRASKAAGRRGAAVDKLGNL
jgi:hypothetical protein